MGMPQKKEKEMGQLGKEADVPIVPSQTTRLGQQNTQEETLNLIQRANLRDQVPKVNINGIRTFL